MDIVKALAPAFAAGFAVQQVLEIIASFLDLRNDEPFQKYKKPILATVSLVLGFMLAFGVEGLSVLTPLLTKVVTDATGKATPVVPQIDAFLDALVTGLVVSAGTEGINSILKFLKYTKEDKKNEAAAKISDEEKSKDTSKADDDKVTSKEALAHMNRQ